MVQVLSAPQPKRPSFAQSLVGGIAEGVGPAIEKYEGLQRQNRQNQAISKTFGSEIANLPPELQKLAVAESLKYESKEKLFNKKQDFLKKILGNENKENKNIEIEEKKPREEKFSNISDEDILEATSIDPILGKALRDAKNSEVSSIEGKEKEKRRKFESDREFHSKRSDPIINSAEQVVKNAPITKGLIQQQRRDIASGNTSGIIPFLVDKLGLEAYRDPESARFKTANKQRFVESIHELGGAGARPNQFIEQQLTQAQATLGRSEEANESVLDLEEFVQDLKLQRAELELQLAEQDNEKFGYVKSDIGQRADKLIKDFTERRQDEMAYTIRQRHEQNLSDQDLIKEIVENKIGPDTPLTMRVARILMIKNNDDEKKATAEAKKLGFKIPKD